MLKKIALAAALICGGLPALAQCAGVGYLETLTADETASLTAAADKIPYGQGTVWQAHKGGKTVTVVGTMHIYDARLDGIRNLVTEEVQNADLVLVEATLDDQRRMQELIVTDPGMLFITEGPTLPDMLDEQTWKLIAEAASSRSIPSFMASKMQPWYLSLMLSFPPCAMQDLVQGKMGLDHLIMQDASAAGVPLQAIEDMMTLFELFNQDPLEDQIDMLRLNLLGAELQQQMFVSMLDRYFAGDIATLWEMSRLALDEAPELDTAKAEEAFASIEQAMLVERNLRWQPVIRKATDENDRLVIAVGAAHLIGESGVLQFLNDEGWTLTQIN